MSKEEWAELCYLLAKLRYIILGLIANSNNSSFIESEQKYIDEINHLMQYTLYDGEQDER